MAVIGHSFEFTTVEFSSRSTIRQHYKCSLQIIFLYHMLILVEADDCNSYWTFVEAAYNFIQAMEGIIISLSTSLSSPAF